MVKKKKKVEVYKGWCKQCGICVAFCPQNALDTGKDGCPVLKSPENCKGCDWCEIRCPDFAIVVSPDEKKESK